MVGAHMTPDSPPTDMEHLAAIIHLQQQQQAILTRFEDHMEWEEERHDDFKKAIGNLRDKLWYMLLGLLGFAFSLVGYLAIEGPPWATFGDVVTAIEHHRYELHQP